LPVKAPLKKNLSAMKRARQAVKHNLRNTAVRSSLKTRVKKIEAAISAGNSDEAQKALLEAIKDFDKAASKGVIHKNTAARNISRLTKKVNALVAA
jgi:small subunit ribosomal protein S20